MNVAHLLIRTARAWPHASAVFVGEREITDYGGLARHALGLANGLRARFGVEPGDRIAVCMSNVPEYLEVLYAIWTAGLVAVPINAKLHPREVAFIVGDAGARVAFVSDDLSASVGGAVADVTSIVAGSPDYRALAGGPGMGIESRADDDLAWLFYTSGTTGRPKGVMLTHRNLLAMTSCYFIDVHAAAADDTAAYAAPFSHGAGLYSFPHVIAGARHAFPESRGFDPDELCALASHHRNACLFAAPTMVKRLTSRVGEQSGHANAFRTIVYGGGPMYLDTIERALAVIGPRFVQIYGQGESPMTITALSKRHLSDVTHPRHRERIASVGVAQTLVEVHVVDEAGIAVRAGETGEVIVRGDTVMKGYWNQPHATAETLRDGWLYTGDMGSFDDDGFLTLKDRSRDLIITGGANVYPREVEEVLLMHPAVDDVAVVGRPHPEWGEEIVAFVVWKPGTRPAASELDALCLDRIARFKRPRTYRAIDALPTNNYGKVLKRELRRLLEADDAPS